MSDTTTGGATASGPLLALKGMSKSFGPVEAMKDVDLEVRPGEVMGLLGDNGAGKSTLIKAIAGVQPADEGVASFEGQSVRLDSPQAATELGIATVYQDLALCENLDIVANLFLGQGGLGRQPVRPRRDFHGAEDRRAPGVARRHHDPERPHRGRAPLGRPAPSDRDRPLAPGRAQDRPSRRADRGPRRRPDARTSSS